MAKDCAVDLAKYNVAFVSLWPGPVRTEIIGESLDDKSLTEDRGRAVSYCCQILCEMFILSVPACYVAFQ